MNLMETVLQSCRDHRGAINTLAEQLGTTEVHPPRPLSLGAAMYLDEDLAYVRFVLEAQIEEKHREERERIEAQELWIETVQLAALAINTERRIEAVRAALGSGIHPKSLWHTSTDTLFDFVEERLESRTPVDDIQVVAA